MIDASVGLIARERVAVVQSCTISSCSHNNENLRDGNQKSEIRSFLVRYQDNT